MKHYNERMLLQIFIIFGVFVCINNTISLNYAKNFEKSMDQFLAANTALGDKQQLEDSKFYRWMKSCWKCCCCFSCCDEQRKPWSQNIQELSRFQKETKIPVKGQLIFTAFDMNKELGRPDTSFLYVIMHYNLQAWKMVPSYNEQQAIHLFFGLPSDCDRTKQLTYTLYLLTENTGESVGSAGSIRMCTYLQPSLCENDRNTSLVVTADNFLINESEGIGSLQNFTVSTDINIENNNMENLVVLTIDRIRPLDSEEYNKNIYLYCVVISYEKL